MTGKARTFSAKGAAQGTDPCQAPSNTTELVKPVTRSKVAPSKIGRLKEKVNIKAYNPPGGDSRVTHTHGEKLLRLHLFSLPLKFDPGKWGTL